MPFRERRLKVAAYGRARKAEVALETEKLKSAKRLKRI